MDFEKKNFFFLPILNFSAKWCVECNDFTKLLKSFPLSFEKVIADSFLKQSLFKHTHTPDFQTKLG